jgi:N-acetylmuramoyl-L-alanine amidase
MSSDTVPKAMEVAQANTLPHRPIQDLHDLLKEVARSRDLASDIQESLAAFVRDGSRPKRNRGVRKAPLVVLTGADMPSVLAEISFLSNPADEQWLMRPDNRQRVAEGLYHGIEKYLLNISSISTQLRPSRQTDSQP